MRSHRSGADLRRSNRSQSRHKARHTAPSPSDASSIVEVAEIPRCRRLKHAAEDCAQFS